MNEPTRLPGQRSSAAPLTSAIERQIEVERIRVEAFLLAEKRGFAAGHELEDWVAAERQR